MPTEQPGVQLEIAHVLFIDIVGYSKLLTNEQRELVRTLNSIVRSTDEFRTADATGNWFAYRRAMGWYWRSSPAPTRQCAVPPPRP